MIAVFGLTGFNFGDSSFQKINYFLDQRAPIRFGSLCQRRVKLNGETEIITYHSRFIFNLVHVSRLAYIKVFNRYLKDIDKSTFSHYTINVLTEPFS